MLFTLYACPNYTDNAVRLIDALGRVPGIALGLISQEPVEWLPAEVRQRLRAFQQVRDVFDTSQLVAAAAHLRDRMQQPIHRLFGAVEPLQVPLGQAREILGVEGMRAAQAFNFRDKAHMKLLLRQAGIPCARYREVASAAEAFAFAAELGYPLVAKPPAGAGSMTTYKVNNPAELEQALHVLQPAPGAETLLEEFIQGNEHSFDTFTINGAPVFHSLSHYLPNPLDCMRNPWIQWRVVIPREVDDPRYDDIRQAAFKSLDTLGMGTGISHLEWFRRPDGSIAVSEVAARPPGAQILTLISRACDFDAIGAWAHLMVHDHFDPPTRQYAVGAAYLRGMGSGTVRAVHGLDHIQREFGHLVTDAKIPTPGQAAAANYEGEGYIIVRHPDTAVVEHATARIVEMAKVELG